MTTKIQKPSQEMHCFLILNYEFRIIDWIKCDFLCDAAKAALVLIPFIDCPSLCLTDSQAMALGGRSSVVG